MSADSGPQVLQLIPAPGWWACYHDGDAEPVQCFALVEYADPEPFRVVLSVIPGRGMVEFAEDAGNFERLEYRGSAGHGSVTVLRRSEVPRGQ